MMQKFSEIEKKKLKLYSLKKKMLIFDKQAALFG